MSQNQCHGPDARLEHDPSLIVSQTEPRLVTGDPCPAPVGIFGVLIVCCSLTLADLTASLDSPEEVARSPHRRRVGQRQWEPVKESQRRRGGPAFAVWLWSGAAIRLNVAAAAASGVAAQTALVE